MGAILHDSFIAWPDGGGETPCSQAYLDAFTAFEDAERQSCEAEEMEDWPAYTEHGGHAEILRLLLERMRAQGHVGQPLEYAEVIPAMALLGGASMTIDGRVYNGERFVGSIGADCV